MTAAASYSGTRPALVCGAPLDAATHARVRRRAIFEACKWDPQVGDVATLSRIPLLLAADAWADLARLAESLAREIRAAEAELVRRPDLWRALGLPWSVRRALGRIRRDGPPRGFARLVRFDFHPTPDGWRISEANTDVPGGFVEAQGFTSLVAEAAAETTDGAAPAGAPAAAYADAVRREVPAGGLVALVHATAWSDDRQVMEFVARELTRRDLRTALVSPEHLRWDHGRARVETDWVRGPADAVLRFFPAEWLLNCRRASGWPSFFAGAATPLSNPASALVTQSKRLPLVWDRLTTPMPTWRALLPETRSARGLSGDPGPEWVVKPALGRVGEAVAVSGVTSDRERAQVVRAARRTPGDWVVQRRFASVPLDSADGPLHACVGVFTVDETAAGIYGRVARRPLVDMHAQDAAVLVTSGARASVPRPSPVVAGEAGA